MRRYLGFVTVLALVLSGCAFSKVDPEARVTVSGRALDSTGKPLPTGTKVLLFKEADIGSVLFGAVFAIGSLGTVCLLPHAPTLCHRARSATTDAQGRYRFHLKGSDTQGSIGTTATLDVVFAGGAHRASTTISFSVRKSTVVLPDAQLWDAAPHVTNGNRSWRLTWKGLPRTAGDGPTYSAQLFQPGTSVTWWTQPASGGRATVDGRLLEDRAGELAAAARTRPRGALGADGVRANYFSTRVPVGALVGAPPSRGKVCAPVTGTDHSNDGSFTDCGMTDGDLTQTARLAGDGAKVVTGTVVDLGRSRPIDLVVTRGFSGQLIVEISADGRTFHRIATDSGSVATAAPAGTRARYVRVRSPSGLDESLASELSVW